MGAGSISAGRSMRTADQRNVDTVDLARMQPQGDAGMSLQVVISRAVGVGMGGAEGIEVSCTCEVLPDPEREDSSFTTARVHGGKEIIWDHEDTVFDPTGSSDLQFSVTARSDFATPWQHSLKGASAGSRQQRMQDGEDHLLGKALLRNRQFSRNGFDAAVTISHPDRGIQGTLHVSVQVPERSSQAGSRVADSIAGVSLSRVSQRPIAAAQVANQRLGESFASSRAAATQPMASRPLIANAASDFQPLQGQQYPSADSESRAGMGVSIVQARPASSATSQNNRSSATAQSGYPIGASIVQPRPATSQKPLSLARAAGLTPASGQSNVVPPGKSLVVR